MKNHLKPISLFKQTNFSKTIWWQLKVNISGYQNKNENNLVTEILKNRIFRIIYPNHNKYAKTPSRVLVQLFEDGYICWINLDELIIEQCEPQKHHYVDKEYSIIEKKIPLILNWIKDQSELKNRYLWGGTLGPNYDCSGLIQTAFFMQDIFIPRDSHQIKSFCKHLFSFKETQKTLLAGDLLFFGDSEKCDHIGIYQGKGLYYHCSGNDYGRNGIGVDTLNKTNDKISNHYKSKLISAGRVIRQYRWDRTIR